MLRYWVPHVPMYLLNLAKIWALILCLWVCNHLPSHLKMFLCVSETSKKLGAWGPNRCWDIDFPTPLCICSTWPSYEVPMLHLWVCQHLPSGLKMFLCVSEFSKKFGVWDPNRCWEIDSPMYLLKLAKIWALILCLWVCQHLPSGLKMFLCVSATSKKIWCMGP